MSTFESDEIDDKFKKKLDGITFYERYDDVKYNYSFNLIKRKGKNKDVNNLLETNDFVFKISKNKEYLAVIAISIKHNEYSGESSPIFSFLNFYEKKIGEVYINDEFDENEDCSIFEKYYVSEMVIESFESAVQELVTELTFHNYLLASNECEEFHALLLGNKGVYEVEPIITWYELKDAFKETYHDAVFLENIFMEAYIEGDYLFRVKKDNVNVGLVSFGNTGGWIFGLVDNIRISGDGFEDQAAVDDLLYILQKFLDDKFG